MSRTSSCISALTVALASLLLVAAGPARAVNATWGGGTGDWDDATQWDTDPLYPCNGQGGNNYDVTVSTGGPTVNLDCTVDTLTQSNGTIDGGFDLLINQTFTFTGGTQGGSGTTRVGGGFIVSGSGTKSLDGTRTIVQEGGAGSWSAGSISLGNDGATVRNEAIWNLTGPTRSMNDTSNTGTFENDAAGTLNVTLDNATRVVTFSPGTLQLDGTVNANLGIVAFNGDGTHGGSFAGAATVRFAGGDQILGSGASVTVADLDVTGGTLGVDPAASFAPGNTDISAGALNVTDAFDTVTSGTASVSGGQLGGAGTFEVTGSLGWTGGTQGDAGTTRVLGGLDVTTSGTKFLADTRTLVHAGGTGTWTAGTIGLGNSGASVRNETVWNLSGPTRSMNDTSNTGTFENAAAGTLNVTLDNATRVLTFSPGTLQLDGTVNANQGIVAFNGDGTHNGTFAGAASLRFSGGDQLLGPSATVTVADLEVTGGTLDVDPGATFGAGNTDITAGALNVIDAGDTIVTGTATVSGGVLGGPGTFQVTGSLGWTGGTMGGDGTTEAAGGLDVTNSGTKFLSGTRTLVQTGGTGSWTAGTIGLGNGGASLRNESVWNLSGPTRSMNDSGNTGSFENTASGVLNVTLDNATRVLTISPGSVQQDGTVNANEGIVAFNGDGVHGGSFAGAASVRFAGGNQTLGSGSSVTAADLDVTGGTLDVDAAATWAAGNTDLSAGTLNVVGGGNTITSGTATVSGGTLGGAGTFEVTGSLGFTGGTMGDTGTTRALGGLNVTNSGTKFLSGSRTLVNEGGVGSWAAGTMSLGSGGATVRNESVWNVTGPSRSMNDTSDTGTFENAAGGIMDVLLDNDTRQLTISTGSASNAGTITVALGTLAFLEEYVQTAGTTRLAGGSLDGPPLLDFQGGLLEGGGDVLGDVTMAGTVAPGLSPGLAAGQLDIDGFLTFQPGSAFDLEVLGATRGSEYDSVTATGAVTLDGTFDVIVAPAFRDSVPPGSSFIVLEQTGGSPLAGSFTNVANGERYFNADLDSFVVNYGPGSTEGADRVVLTEFVKFFFNSGLMIGGTSAGGTLTLIIDGVTVVVNLTPGMTPAQVAAAIAAAINANSELESMGIKAVSEDGKFFTNGLLTNKTNTDPGITLSSPFDVPALGGLGAALLSGLLAAAGLRARRRSAV